ncbi:uncharacterized protein LOC114268945 [Camellia sinensis]|uniref:uncharacterized protein LOC114268945 n=1 Tax=Camellia sinensis TaxID=4442 RepID=UPI001035C016|nr:uncharacterized protein LOC114268945 [Camellia sinensis]
MKDLGLLQYFLGNEVTSSPNGYFLSQAKYANEIIHRADPTLYRELVVCLVYLMVTRPDLAYVVHVVSQFVSAPRSTQWAALIQILRYLRGTTFQGLLLSSTSSLDLVTYAILIGLVMLMIASPLLVSLCFLAIP